MSRFAVIMAGGSGTRFWPKSSQKKPKQFLNLTNPKNSMLQVTFKRLQGVVPSAHRWVIGTKSIEKQIKKHVPVKTVLSEPMGRNTMAAACWSAWTVFAKDPEGSLALLPADAHVANEPRFREKLRQAFDIAEGRNRIVCLGIKPTFPATGYGYIETKTPLTDGSLPINRFVEKPDYNTANHYVSTGCHVWNAGIFVFKASVFVNEVKKRAPEFYDFFQKRAGKPGQIIKDYSKLPHVPVDISLMEQTDLGEVISGDYGWNDVGSWAALIEVNKPDKNRNLIAGAKQAFSHSSANNTIDVNGKKFVALVGVNDLVVVETRDVLLVCHRDQAQDIKLVVDHLKSDKKLSSLL